MYLIVKTVTPNSSLFTLLSTYLDDSWQSNHPYLQSIFSPTSAIWCNRSILRRGWSSIVQLVKYWSTSFSHVPISLIVTREIDWLAPYLITWLRGKLLWSTREISFKSALIKPTALTKFKCRNLQQKHFRNCRAKCTLQIQKEVV